MLQRLLLLGRRVILLGVPVSSFNVPPPFKPLINRTIISISGNNEFIVRGGHQTNHSAKLQPRQGPLTLRPTLSSRHRRELDSNPIPPLEPKASSEGGEVEEKFFKKRKVNAMEAVSIRGVIVRLLKMRVIKNMTKNGKYSRFSAMVAAGNGQGGVGIAHSKAINASDAVSKATRLAVRSMEYYERWQSRTLFHDDQVKFKSTILIVRPAAPGAGRRCHPAISEMCRCLGIKDISAKVHGSRHPMNVSQAFLMVLKRQKTPEMVAQDSGMRIVDVLKVYQQGCEELTRTLRSERYSTQHLKNHHV